VPIGKLLSVPEKREKGVLDDDGIDDAEEKAANARPRRALPERRPSEPRDPSGSVLTPTGVVANRRDERGDATRGVAVSESDALAELETRVRVQLRAMHTAAKSAKDLVFEAFRRVDAFGAGVLSRDAFIEGLAALGVDVSAAEAAALCSAADPEGGGETVSCAAFARRALRGAARADADDADVCRGWPVTDDDFVRKKIVYPRCRSFTRAPSDLDASLIDRSMFKPDADLRLDFVYGYDGLECAARNVFVTADPNKVVYCAAAVAVVHDAARDEQAHFRGHTRDITCLTLCDAEVTVGGVTYPPKTLCATGQKVPSADAASYVDDEEEGDAEGDAADAADAPPRPFVSVWDVRTLREVARVRLAADARAVAGVAFSPDGATLVTVGCDNNHTVQVWDWRVARVGEPSLKKSSKNAHPNDSFGDSGGRSKTRAPAPKKLRGLLHENTGFKERPGGVFGVEFDPFASDGAGDDSIAKRFVSYGKKHVKSWSLLGKTGEWVSRPMSFGAFGVQDVCSVAFLPPLSRERGFDGKNKGGNGNASLVTGHPDGSLLVWRDGRAVSKIERAHGKGARAVQPDGTVAWGGGVRAMRLRLGSTWSDGTLITGGADGVLTQWAVVDGTLAGKITEPVPLADRRAARAAASAGTAFDRSTFGVRAIDVVPGTDRVVAGTSRCELWDVDLHPERETARVMTRGHAASLRAACWHPSDPNRFYTACSMGAVHAWDAEKTAMTKRCSLAFAASAIAVGGDAENDAQTHVAVGGENGEVLVLTEASFELVFAVNGRTSAAAAGVEDLKFSPDGGSRLAVTYRDGKVEVFRRRVTREDRADGPPGSTKNEASRFTRYEKIARFKGHSASARHVDWSADGATLATCGADYEILHWDVPNKEERKENKTSGAQNLSSQRDRRFATRTGTLGFPVMGVWPAASDGTDVNALDVSPSGRYAVTADDGGFMKLFAYPVLAECAAHRAYRGHAGHVAMVRFNCDGTRVVSTGGRDRSAFQFSVVRRPDPAPAPAPKTKRWLPLDADGKAFGFRTPREGENEVEDVFRTDDAEKDALEIDEDDEDAFEAADREADLPVFVPRPEDVFGAPSSLLELDANAAGLDPKRDSPLKETEKRNSGWRPLRQLVNTMAALGSPSRKEKEKVLDDGVRRVEPEESSPKAIPAEGDSSSAIRSDGFGLRAGDRRGPRRGGGFSSEEVLEEIEA
jgi:microtubule-associated protein-like 6